VQHLGAEFQRIASERAAELTTAYKTLSNAALRAEYDALLASTAPQNDQPTGATEPEPPPPVIDRFRQERADRDDILRRVVLARVRECFADPDYELQAYGGFDLAFVPRVRGPVFRRTGKPSLLVRVADKVDGSLVLQAWTDALRARVAEKPVVLLLLAREVDRKSVTVVIDDRRRKHPKVAESIFPVTIDMADWSAEIPPHSPDSVRATIERLRNFGS
jgi:curved DNA-binding protein CbpA